MIIDGTAFSKCKDEQQFKMLYIKKNLQSEDNYVFRIETEETVHGFPDVMEFLLSTRETNFYEFKISDKYGKIKFQPTQPAFYKSHEEMNISVVALDRKTMHVFVFPVSWLFYTETKYCLNDKAEVNLSKILPGLLKSNV